MKSNRGVRVTVVTALLVAAVFGVAWAHATLVRSMPPSGAHLNRPPTELRLVFSEAVTARTSRVELVSPDSQRLALAVRADTADGKSLLADVPPLPVVGTYRVEWRLVGTDGHAVTGRYSFIIDSIPVVQSVDSVSASQAPMGHEEGHDPSADRPLQQAIRFLTFLSMMIVFGSVAFGLFVLPRATRSDSAGSLDFRTAVEDRLVIMTTFGAWSLLVLALVRLTSHGITLSGSLEALRIGDLADLLTSSTWGRGWSLQVAATIGLLLALRRRTPVRWGVLAAVGVVLAISASFLGHPAAVPDVPLLAMGLDAVHVLAAGGWAGGILALAVAALPKALAVPSDDRVGLVRSLLRAFSPLALSCAAVLAVTGAVGAWLQLRDLGLVLGSPYGLALVRKVVVVAVIVVLGAYHWRVVQPSVNSDRSVARLRLSIALDVTVVLLVLVLTAILTGTAPPVR